jgi:hypothetical protein
LADLGRDVEALSSMDSAIESLPDHDGLRKDREMLRRRLEEKNEEESDEDDD